MKCVATILVIFVSLTTWTADGIDAGIRTDYLLTTSEEQETIRSVISNQTYLIETYQDTINAYESLTNFYAMKLDYYDQEIKQTKKRERVNMFVGIILFVLGGVTYALIK